MATENTGKSTDTTAESVTSDDQQQQQQSSDTETTDQAIGTTAESGTTDKSDDSTDSTDTTGETTDSSDDSAQQPEMVSVELLKTVIGILKPEQPESKTEDKTEESSSDSTDSKEDDSTDNSADSTEDKVDPQVAALTKQNDALQKVVRNQLLASVPDALKPLIPEDLAKATEYVQSDAFRTAAAALKPDPAAGTKGETGSNSGSESSSAPKTFATITSTDLDTAFAGVLV